MRCQQENFIGRNGRCYTMRSPEVCDAARMIAYLKATAAVTLYEKLGFTVYGHRPNSFKLKSGAYADELLMVLNLKE